MADILIDARPVTSNPDTQAIINQRASAVKQKEQETDQFAAGLAKIRGKEPEEDNANTPNSPTTAPVKPAAPKPPPNPLDQDLELARIAARDTLESTPEKGPGLLDRLFRRGKTRPTPEPAPEPNPESHFKLPFKPDGLTDEQLRRSLAGPGTPAPNPSQDTSTTK